MVATAEEFLAKNPRLLDEDRTDPRVVRLITRIAVLLQLWFRFRLRGLERVPDGACVIVANHSCGAVQEIVLLLRAWRQKFGDRPARGLAHQISWHYPFRIVPVIQKVGAIFAHPEVARRALARGCTLLIFPGGDVEACRPFSARYQVSFAGRTGFARLARESGVPVVPIVLCGAHASFVMTPFGAWTGRRLRWAGLRSFPLTWGMVAFAAAALTTLIFPSLWPLAALAFVQAPLPLPARIEAETLPPMRPLDGEDDATFAARIESEMQRAMDQLAGLEDDAVDLILIVLLMAPRTTVSTAEQTKPVIHYADLVVEIAGEEARIVELRPGKFEKPTALPRYRGRFEARAMRGKETLERVAFDFPLHADAETDDFGDEERKLAAKLRAGVRARTRVRVPLPDGADVIQVYDTKSARAVTVPLKAAAPSPAPAVKEGAPRAR